MVFVRIRRKFRTDTQALVVRGRAGAGARRKPQAGKRQKTAVRGDKSRRASVPSARMLLIPRWRGIMHASLSVAARKEKVLLSPLNFLATIQCKASPS
jgi:hypothetical protein